MWRTHRCYGSNPLSALAENEVSTETICTIAALKISTLFTQEETKPNTAHPGTLGPFDFAMRGKMSSC